MEVGMETAHNLPLSLYCWANFENGNSSSLKSSNSISRYRCARTVAGRPECIDFRETLGSLTPSSTEAIHAVVPEPPGMVYLDAIRALKRRYPR